MSTVLVGMLGFAVGSRAGAVAGLFAGLVAAVARLGLAGAFRSGIPIELNDTQLTGNRVAPPIAWESISCIGFEYQTNGFGQPLTATLAVTASGGIRRISLKFLNERPSAIYNAIVEFANAARESLGMPRLVFHSGTWQVNDRTDPTHSHS
jgi:hypothetical protein